MKAKKLTTLGVTLLAFLQPILAFAQGDAAMPVSMNATPFVWGIFLVIFAIFLARVGMGMINLCFLEQESIASIERRHPYFPSLRTVTGVAIMTGVLILLSLHTITGIAPFDGPNGWKRAALVLTSFGVISIIASLVWPKKSKNYVFAIATGTIITFALIGFQRAMFSTAAGLDPFIMTFGFVSLVIGWKFLFGPWKPRVKAVVLGTFIFWVATHILFKESESERLAHLLATVVALIPAVVWCLLFLQYHKQRLSVVVLMFFSGMLSTVPILMYDKILRSGMELQFFLFRIVPESFTQSSNAFVSGRIGEATGYQSTIIATLISFLLVGLIEELSKFWVLRKSGGYAFTSIEDVIQLGIIVAIGFAFAENVLNPNYFLAFVSDHLVQTQPDWSGFFGNFLGRAVLTNMVHIVATGVLGYYFALSLFAKSCMQEDAEIHEGRIFVPRFLNYFFRLPEEAVFRREMIIIGVLIAIVLHGIFNFLVTLPSILPGNPQTIGDLVGAPAESFLHYIAILVIPSLLYVVGGFWLLSSLLSNSRCTKKRELPVRTDKLVARKAIAS